MQLPTPPPYNLLGQMSNGAPLQGLSDIVISQKDNELRHITTTYITTMYYSALSNLYIQTVLPENPGKVEAEMPRIKIALERSYNDYSLAKEWLKTNGENTIHESSAKVLYDEVLGMEEELIMNMESFYNI